MRFSPYRDAGESVDDTSEGEYASLSSDTEEDDFPVDSNSGMLSPTGVVVVQSPSARSYQQYAWQKGVEKVDEMARNERRHARISTHRKNASLTDIRLEEQNIRNSLQQLSLRGTAFQERETQVLQVRNKETWQGIERVIQEERDAQVEKQRVEDVAQEEDARREREGAAREHEKVAREKGRRQVVAETQQVEKTQEETRREQAMKAAEARASATTRPKAQQLAASPLGMAAKEASPRNQPVKDMSTSQTTTSASSNPAPSFGTPGLQQAPTGPKAAFSNPAPPTGPKSAFSAPAPSFGMPGLQQAPTGPKSAFSNPAPSFGTPGLQQAPTGPKSALSTPAPPSGPKSAFSAPAPSFGTPGLQQAPTGPKSAFSTPAPPSGPKSAFSAPASSFGTPGLQQAPTGPKSAFSNPAPSFGTPGLQQAPTGPKSAFSTPAPPSGPKSAFSAPVPSFGTPGLQQAPTGPKSAFSNPAPPTGPKSAFSAPAPSFGTPGLQLGLSGPQFPFSNPTPSIERTDPSQIPTAKSPFSAKVPSFDKAAETPQTTVKSVTPPSNAKPPQAGSPPIQNTTHTAPVHQAPETATSHTSASAEFAVYRARIGLIKQEILAPVSVNKEWKDFCFRSKRKIIPKIGQLTAKREQIQFVVEEVCNVLDAASGKSDIVLYWVLNFFSKAAASQAETEVAARPTTVGPLSILCMELLLKYPALSNLFFARLVKKCPWMIGHVEGIETEQGRKLMGYKRKSDGKWEDDVTYTNRMCGVITLWSAICSISFKAKTHVHPHPISNAWKMLARFGNMPPTSLVDTHFAVVAALIDFIGVKFLLAYGKQGKKLFRFLFGPWTDYGREHMLPDGLRLWLLGEDWVKERKV